MSIRWKVSAALLLACVCAACAYAEDAALEKKFKDLALPNVVFEAERKTVTVKAYDEKAFTKLVEFIAANGEVQYLCAPNVALPDKAIAQLATLKTIRGFDLSNTGLTNESVGRLAQLEQLQALVLANNAAIDTGCLKHLAKLKSLTEVGLTGTQVTKAHAKELEAAVPGLTMYSLDNPEKRIEERKPELLPNAKRNGEPDAMLAEGGMELDGTQLLDVLQTIQISSRGKTTILMDLSPERAKQTISVLSKTLRGGLEAVAEQSKMHVAFVDGVYWVGTDLPVVSVRLRKAPAPALDEAQKTALAGLLPKLESEDFGARSRAIDGVMKLGPGAVEPLGAYIEKAKDRPDFPAAQMREIMTVLAESAKVADPSKALEEALANEQIDVQFMEIKVSELVAYLNDKFKDRKIAFKYDGKEDKQLFGVCADLKLVAFLEWVGRYARLDLWANGDEVRLSERAAKAAGP